MARSKGADRSTVWGVCWREGHWRESALMSGEVELRLLLQDLPGPHSLPLPGETMHPNGDRNMRPDREAS